MGDYLSLSLRLFAVALVIAVPVLLTILVVRHLIRQKASSLGKKLLIISLSALVYTGIFTVLPSAFPFSACFAPWGFHFDNDYTPNNLPTCLTEIARRVGEPSLCEKFFAPDGYYSWTCVMDVAIGQKDPNICLQFPSKKLDFYNDTYGCIKTFQRVQQDDHLCEKISDKVWQDACLDAYRSAIFEASFHTE